MPDHDGERRGVPAARARLARRQHAACSRPTRRRPTAPRTTRPGCATRSCSACCGTAASPASASRRSTAASASRIEHQHAFTEESLPYEMPLHLNVPHFSILGATLVDFGTDEQKAKYLPPMLGASTSGCSSCPSPPAGPTSPGASRGGARRRRVGDERLEDLEHRGDVGHARDVPRPHRLGRAQAPRPHHVHHGDPPARACRSTPSSR